MILEMAAKHRALFNYKPTTEQNKTMKTLSNRGSGKAVPIVIAVLALALHTVVWQSQAQVVQLTDLNSTAIVDTGSQAGMFHWDVQGQNQLHQQWFWYGVGNGAVRSIDTISAPIDTQLSPSDLTSTYVNPGNYSVSVHYTLTGGSTVAPGQFASSDIGEAIRIQNLSGVLLPFHFYQYSYFNLNGNNNDVVELFTQHGLYNDAYQTDGASGLQETVATPGANHGEVAPLGGTLAKLNSGGPVTLGPPFGAGPVGPGEVTWALEWDMTLAPGATLLISKDKQFSVEITSVPEPSALALLGLGGAALALFKRRAKA
jgi:hypothetical protein